MKRWNIGGVPEHFNLPWRLAIEEGDTKKVGVDLHWSDMSGGTGQMIRGLESGTIDIAIGLTEGITAAILEGLPVKIIQVYVDSPLIWGIHVPYNSEISDPNQLRDATFAISRMGSGSHLMAKVFAFDNGWDADNLKFNVVGDIYGGLWALEKHEAQVFLWEKFTTNPFVEQKKCRRIGEVVTPWPAFVIAAREDIALDHGDLLKQLCQLVKQKANLLRNDPNGVGVFAWRYNLQTEQVAEWLHLTDWNLEGQDTKVVIRNTIDYLVKTGIIKQENTHNWENTCFV